MNNKEYHNAIKAGEDDKIHEWVLSYLLKPSGNNASLAKRLNKDSVFHFGPIDYQIKDLKLILGPDDSFKYFEEQSILDAKVLSMVESLKNGWLPEPFIATDLWDDKLGLADGNHRIRAFEIQGIKTHPTIFYFRNQESLENFKNTLL